MSIISTNRARLLLGCALTAFIAAPAFAEDEAPAVATAGMEAAAASEASLDEIVVTATKVETNLQQTPIAISVLGAQAMTDRHVQSLYNLADGSVPSLRIATFEASQ